MKNKTNNINQALETARKAVAKYAKDSSLLEDLKQMRREEFLKEELEHEQQQKYANNKW